MTMPSTCAIFALYGYTGSTFTTFCGGRIPDRRTGVRETGAGGGGSGSGVYEIVSRFTPFGTPPSTNPLRAGDGSRGVSGVMSDGGSSGAASDDTVFGAFVVACGGGAGTSINCIGIAPMKVSGACGIGSGPTASTCATSAAAMTNAWRMIETSVKPRRMAPPDVNASFAHVRLDTTSCAWFHRTAPRYLLFGIATTMLDVDVLPV